MSQHVTCQTIVLTIVSTVAAIAEMRMLVSFFSRSAKNSTVATAG